MSAPIPHQTALDLPAEDDGLVIIGVARDAVGTQSHSTFRKIDMAAKAGRLVSLSWGEIMVMLPRPLYAEVFAYVARADQESRADALILLLEEGLAACSV